MATKKKAAASSPDDDELVTVELYWDGEKYKDDVDICINGKRILIKRGVPVKIKRCYALVLEQSLAQDKKTKQMIVSEAERYEQAVASGAIS